jgi:Cu+-exporting ATPase
VPTVLGIAIITFFAWHLFAPGLAVMQGFAAAVTVLVIACPCANGLSRSNRCDGGDRAGATFGLLLKGDEALQKLEKIDTIVLDKTGTITAGRPEVTDLLFAPESSSIGIIGDNPYTSEDRVLRIAAALERASEHPLAAAVVRYAQQRGLSLPQPESFESRTGHGVVGIVEGNLTVIGNAELMRNNSIALQALMAGAERLAEEGETPLWSRSTVRSPESSLSLILLPTSIDAIRNFHREGLHVVMLTGDNERTARAIAFQVGVDDVIAGVLPAGTGRCHQASSGRTPDSRHGRRWRERCAGIGAGRGGHHDGQWLRCGNGSGRCNPHAQRTDWRCSRYCALAWNHAGYQTEPVLGFHL